MPLKGFINIGNTCYLNSGFQMLIQNHDFCQIINNNRKSSLILNNIGTIIDNYYSFNSNALDISYIKELVDKRNNIFNGSSQNDAGEFIVFLLDIIDNELKVKNTIFQLVSKISIKCKLKSCLHISTHNEVNNFLILDINKDTLDDCYRDYKARVKMIDENMYYCEYCKEKRIASKRLEIIKWPKHLIIVLNRYNNRKKNDKSIIIPIDWRRNYKLKGFIYHSGSLFSGHYIYIAHHNNEWYV